FRRPSSTFSALDTGRFIHEAGAECRRYDCVHKVVIIQMIYGSCLLLSNCYLWSMVFFWLKNFNVIHLNHT
ncbi:hypothetical protein ACV1CY_19125, partial [Aeromonas caviae]